MPRCQVHVHGSFSHGCVSLELRKEDHVKRNEAIHLCFTNTFSIEPPDLDKEYALWNETAGCAGSACPYLLFRK